MSGNLIRLPPAPHHLLIYTRQQDLSWPGQPPAARGKMFQYCAGARPPCGLLPKLVCCICCMFVVRSLYRDTVLAAAAAARANIIHHHKLNLQIEFSAAQHYAVALQCCMLRAAVPSDDEVTVICRAKVAIKSGGGGGGGATNHGKVSTEDTLT